MADDIDSPFTALGTQLLSTEKLRSDLQRQSTRPLFDDAPAWVLLLWLGGPLLLGNFAFVPLGVFTEYASAGTFTKYAAFTLFDVCVGLVALQFFWLNCYAVLSAEVWWLRLVVFLGLLPALILAILFIPLITVGIAGAFKMSDFRDSLIFFLLLPTLLLAAQLPLWFLRSSFGWQFRRLGAITVDNEEDDARQPLFILHIMLTTAVIALCLAAFRWLPEDSENTAREMATSAAIFAAVTFGIGIPVLWMFTRWRSRFLTWMCALGFPVIFGILIFNLFALGKPWYRIEEELLWPAMLFSVGGLVLILGIAGGVQLLRMHGWTISTRPREARE